MSTLTSSSYQSAHHPHHHQHYHRDRPFFSRNPHHILSESSSSSSAAGRRRHSPRQMTSDSVNTRTHCVQCLTDGAPVTTHLTRYPLPDLARPCDLRESEDAAAGEVAVTGVHSRVNSFNFHTSNHLPSAASQVPSHTRHADCLSSPATGPHSYRSMYTFKKKTPKRYFNLGLFCCCTAGFVFTLGLVLMVWGSSPHEPNAIWISGIVFLFTGGFLFFLGIGSIGLYLSREDTRKKKEEIERTRVRQYAASMSSVRSLTRSSDIYLID